MRLPSIKHFTGVVVGGLLMHAAQAWAEPANPATPATRLITAVAEHSELMPNLEELCDGIGPRLTGSRQLRTAQAWAIEKLTRYGAVNVHLEACNLGNPGSAALPEPAC
jgi:carboxypeptidase Q